MFLEKKVYRYQRSGFIYVTSYLHIIDKNEKEVPLPNRPKTVGSSGPITFS